MGATINNNSDEKSKVSVNDDSTGYLAAKIVPGNGIDTAILNPGGIETLEVTVDETELAGTLIPFAFTTGSIPFSNGTTLIEDNPNLFWDNTNNRLGIGTALPATPIDINGTPGYFTDYLSLNRYATIKASRTELTSLSGGDGDGLAHLELKLNPSSAYNGLSTNAATAWLLTESGNAQNFTTLALRALNFITAHQGVGTISNMTAIGGGGRNSSTGTITTLLGANFTNLNNAGGTVTLNESIRIGQPAGRTSGTPHSVWTTIYGLNIQDQNPTGASNTLTNVPIALKIQNQTASGAYGVQVGTGLNYFAGNTRIGATTAPINALSVTGTADITVQATTPIVSGGTGTGNTLTLKSNDTAWPRTARTTTDFLTIGADFAYPTGSAAAFNSVISSPSITAIDVASPNITTFQVAPSWTYTVAQAWGLAPKAGLNFTPSLVSALASAGSDSIIFYGINGQPQVNGSVGPRTYGNVFGIVGDPRMLGTAGTVTNMIGVRSRGNTISGTTATTFTAFLSDYSNPTGATTTTYRGVHIAPSLVGTTTDFEGVKINAQTTPGGNNIGFYQLGTAMHNRLQGYVQIGADSTPTNPLHIIDTSSGATDYLVKLRNNAVANNTATGIKFTNSTNDAIDHASIVAIRTNSPSAESTDLTFATTLDGSNRNIERVRIDSTGRVGIGTASPTAKLHLAAGTATANTAPLKFTSGTNLTVAEAGAIEYNGVRFNVTSLSTATRQPLVTALYRVVTDQLFSNTAAAQTVYEFTVPGGTLGTENQLETEFAGSTANNKGSSGTVTILITYGASTVLQFDLTIPNNRARITALRFTLTANGATNSQTAIGYCFLTDDANSNGLSFPITDSFLAKKEVIAEDSTADKVLKITMTMNVASSNFSTRVRSIVTRLV